MPLTVNVRRPVVLDGDAVKQCFDHHLQMLCGGEGVWLDENDVVMEDDDYRHGTPTSSRVKNPSAVQVAALKLRTALKNHKVMP